MKTIKLFFVLTALVLLAGCEKNELEVATDAMTIEEMEKIFYSLPELPSLYPTGIETYTNFRSGKSNTIVYDTVGVDSYYFSVPLYGLDDILIINYAGGNITLLYKNLVRLELGKVVKRSWYLQEQYPQGCGVRIQKNSGNYTVFIKGAYGRNWAVSPTDKIFYIRVVIKNGGDSVTIELIE